MWPGSSGFSAHRVDRVEGPSAPTGQPTPVSSMKTGVAAVSGAIQPSVPSRTVDLLAGATLVVNILIPKGGFYLHGIPITWGYLLLGVSALGALATSGGGTKWSRGGLLSVAGIAGFGLLVSANLAFRPIEADFADQVLPFLVSVVVVPLASIVVGRRLVQRFGIAKLARIITISVGAVAAWGVLHFAIMNAFHAFIGIPYVTVTGGDLASVALKNINRGGVLKLVSTYNNGNIFGVSMLIWFPLVALSKWAGWSGWVTRLALLLTISRTAWIGWLVAETGGRIFGRRRRSDLLALPAFLAIALVAIVVAAVLWFRHPERFLVDPSLGGRVGQFSGPISLLGGPFHAIREVVYMSVLHDFGLIGLVVFLAVWSWPLLASSSSRAARLAKAGLVAYLVVMISDGAFVLVPTQWTYWTVASIVLFAVHEDGAESLTQMRARDRQAWESAEAGVDRRRP